MNHKLMLHHLGPIEDCEITISDFIVLTGPQSSGKSTIAKAIYYFRSVKQDVLNLMTQGGPGAVYDENTSWKNALERHLRNKFLELFGTSWAMPHDMQMKYEYKDGISIRVYLNPDPNDSGKNYVRLEFSKKLSLFLEGLDSHIYADITPAQKTTEESYLIKVFDDKYETVFIPAGRNLITLLTTQLNYIFTSLENSQLRNIDYITRRYTEMILRLKPSFNDGIDGLIYEATLLPEGERKYKNHRTALSLLKKYTTAILKGEYRYVNSEERLYLEEGNYVKINYTSSGQQEIVWVLNLLTYYLVTDKKVFMILEEPESHLFPDAQQKIGEILALFKNEGNQVLVTTHSPYLLGTFNYQLIAAQARKEAVDAVKEKLHKRLWLSHEQTSAMFVHDGIAEKATIEEDGLILIRNELIDGASESINTLTDSILELGFESEDINGY